MKIVNNIALIEGDEYISKWVLQMGRLDHDQNMLPLVLPYINSDSIVIDAGANIGSHTYAYAKIAKVVYAFEPNKESFKCLEYNLIKFKNVDLFNWGLSDEECKIKLNEVPTNAGMSYAEKSKKGITTITIDSLDLEKVDFIKIDCEGFEHKILKGAEQTVRRFMPTMLIEINTYALKRNNTSNKEIYTYLDELGYDYKNIYPGQSLYEEQLDLICTPKN